MPTLAAARSFNAAFNPSFVPVVVVTGATSGIGEALSRLIASTLKGRVRIILVGRNKAAAEKIIASLPSAATTVPAAGSNGEESVPPESPSPAYEFMECDLTLMSNANALAQTIRSRYSKVNYLIHSAGVFGLGGRVDSAEGIDLKLTTRFYSRFALTCGLMPLLEEANKQGEKAGVLSILGAGLGAKEVDIEDLGLKKGYSGVSAILHSLTYNELMVSEFAKRYPSISFTHIYPGSVDTGMFISQKPFIKFGLAIIRPFLRLLLTTKEDCAEWMLYALLNAQDGMNRRNNKGDDIGMERFPKLTAKAKGGDTDLEKVFWEHCMTEARVPKPGAAQ